MFYERIKALCDERNVRITSLVQSLGLSKGNIEIWRKGKVPNAATLIKLSDYFSVSIDYLLGREEKLELYGDELSEDEIKLLEDYRQLNNQGKEYIRETMEMVIHKYKKAFGFPDMEIAEEIV